MQRKGEVALGNLPWLLPSLELCVRVVDRLHVWVAGQPLGRVRRGVAPHDGDLSISAFGM